MTGQKEESLFSVHIEDGIGLLVLCILILYFYNMKYPIWEVLIYSAAISGIVGSIVYIIRKAVQETKKK